MQYIGLIPLFGGALIGAEQAIGVPPKYILSYSAFQKNDNGYLYYNQNVLKRKIPYYNLDNEQFTPLSQIDLVISVCPCAGLSSLNSTSHDLNTKNNKQKNDWMLKTAQYTLSVLKPQVYMGQNALKLSSDTGKPIRDKMIELADKYGYKLTIVRTDLFNYGIPQSRTRVLYFFNKGNKFLTFDRPNIQCKLLKDFMKDMPDDYNFKHTKNKLKIQNKDLGFKFLLQKKFNNNFSQLYKQLVRTKLNSYTYIYTKDLRDQFKQYTDDKKAHRVIDLIYQKKSAGKGVFYTGVWIDKVLTISSLNGRSAEVLASPMNQGYMISLAQSMYLMGLPKDFRFNDKDYIDQPSHIDDKLFQNVSPAIVKFYVQQLKEPKLIDHDQRYLLLNYIPTKLTHKRRMQLIGQLI